MLGDWDLENLHYNSTNTEYYKQNAVFLEYMCEISKSQSPHALKLIP